MKVQASSRVGSTDRGSIPNSQTKGRLTGLISTAMAAIAILAISSLVVRASCGGANFALASGSPVATGANPQAMASADFNMDGKLDLAVGNGNSRDLTVLLGDGIGGYTAAVGSPKKLGDLVRAIAIGDFNMDGKPDIAVALPNAEVVEILLNDGSGTFPNTPSSAIGIDAGSQPSGLVVGDFNLDGKPDFAVTSKVALGAVKVFLNKGGNVFSEAAGSPIAVGDNPWGLAGADFNADGKLDLAVTNLASNNVSILMGNGSGGFAPAGGSPYTTGANPVWVITGDFNLDNKIDLAIANFLSLDLTILMGNGSGGFTAAASSPVSTGVKSFQLALADFNGDGKPDLVVPDALSAKTQILLGDGAGMFAAAAGSPVNAGYAPYTVVTGDFNSDGRPDFAAASNTNNQLSVEINTCGVGASVFQFSQANFSAPEELGALTITVTRSGDTGGATTVNYTTNDGTATQKSDFEFNAGMLSFAPGETSKSFPILINEDMYTEGTETFTISLTNPSGGTLGPVATANLSILDDAPEWTTNPIDDPQSFVYTHYHDFLNREPDPGGLSFWAGEFASCAGDQKCIDAKRVNVSVAFYLSIEFQQTGYLVYRTYKAAFGNLPGAPVPVKFLEFLPDTEEIAKGVVVGQGAWQKTIALNKTAFMNEFVQRPRFTAAYPATMTPAQFVDALFANAGYAPSTKARQDVINDFSGSALSIDTAARAQALTDVAEDQSFSQQEFNRAFVLMQYFGYLRRDPNAAPEPGLNFNGYNFWLNKLNQFNGNYNDADMVRAFIASAEYRQRFGL